MQRRAAAYLIIMAFADGISSGVARSMAKRKRPSSKYLNALEAAYHQAARRRSVNISSVIEENLKIIKRRKAWRQFVSRSPSIRRGGGMAGIMTASAAAAYHGETAYSIGGIIKDMWRCQQRSVASATHQHHRAKNRYQ